MRKKSDESQGQMVLSGSANDKPVEASDENETPVDVDHETSVVPPDYDPPADGDSAGIVGNGESLDQPASEVAEDRRVEGELSEGDLPVVAPTEKRLNSQADDQPSKREPVGSPGTSEPEVGTSPKTSADDHAAQQPPADESAGDGDVSAESAPSTGTEFELEKQPSEHVSEEHPHDAQSRAELQPDVVTDLRVESDDDGGARDDGDVLIGSGLETSEEQDADAKPGDPAEDGEPPAEGAPDIGGDSESEDSEDARPELDGRIFYLTNRYNYLDNLSARLIRPGDAMEKYYQDLLAIRVGVVPLLNTAAGWELVECVEGEHPHAFPVLLELDVEQIGDAGLPALSVDREPLSGTLVDGSMSYAPDGVIPMSVVQAAYFRSEDEKVDFLSRRAQYKNLDVESIDLRVDADLFEKMSLSIDELKSWLDGFGKIGKVSVNNVQMADRVAGGICLAGAAAPADQRYIELIADLIRGVKPSKARLKGLPYWLVGGRLQTLKPEARKKMDLEEITFGAVSRVILDTDPGERWRPREVLKQIVALVESVSLKDEDREKFRTTTDYIRRVLLNEVDLEPFKSGRGISTAKALLIFLQRPEPNRVLQAGSSYPGATEGELVTAAVYSGLLLGLAQIPAEFRANGIDDVLATMEAWFLNQKASSPLVTGDRKSIDPTISTRVGPDGYWVASIDLERLGDFEIRRRLSLHDLLKRVDITPHAREEVVRLTHTLAKHFQTQEWVDECLWSYLEGKSEKAPPSLGLPPDAVVYRGSRDARVVPDVDLLLQRLDEVGLPNEIDEQFRGPFLRAQFPAVQPDRSPSRRRSTWGTPPTRRS